MATWQIVIRRKTAAEYTSENPVLDKEELGLETDTGKYKVGDGVTKWTMLPYANYLAANVSADANNAIEFGTDLGLFVEKTRISGDTNNVLTYGTDNGLYVPKPPEEVKISTNTGNIIKKGTDGGLFAKQEDPAISVDTDNLLQKKSDGLFVKLPAGGGLTGIAASSAKYDEINFTRNTDKKITSYTFKKQFEGEQVFGSATITRDTVGNITSIVETYTAGTETITETTAVTYTDGNKTKITTTLQRS